MYAAVTGAAFIWLPAAAEAGVSDEPPMSSPRIYEDATDEQLVSWSAEGDRRAFDAIVVRHGPLALRTAARLVRDRATAEDLAQEAFVRAWSQARRFDPRRARFTTWLYRIVVNLCIDHQRQSRPQPLPDGIDPVDPAAGAEEMLTNGERSARLAGAIDELPASQRAALVLVYDEGLSGADAARVLGTTVKAVERLLARARGYLRGRLRAP